jgi:hypothetical protein
MVLSRDKQDIRNQRAKDKRRLLKINTNIQPDILEPLILEPITPEILEPLILEPITPDILEPITPEILEPLILEPITPDILEPLILEPITSVEPALSKFEILANKRRQTLADARTKIKPKGFYKEEISKRDQEIETLKRLNITLYEMATLNIKPNIDDKDIPDYIFNEVLQNNEKRPSHIHQQQQEIQHHQQQQIQQIQQIQQDQQHHQQQQIQQIQQDQQQEIQQEIQQEQEQQMQQIQQIQQQEKDYLSTHLYAKTLQSKIKNTMMQNMMRETFG